MGHHGVKLNFGGHTGATQSIGKVPTISTSTNNNLNTRSYTDT